MSSINIDVTPVILELLNLKLPIPGSFIVVPELKEYNNPPLLP